MSMILKTSPRLQFISFMKTHGTAKTLQQLQHLGSEHDAWINPIKEIIALNKTDLIERLVAKISTHTFETLFSLCHHIEELHDILDQPQYKDLWEPRLRSLDNQSIQICFKENSSTFTQFMGTHLFYKCLEWQTSGSGIPPQDLMNLTNSYGINQTEVLSHDRHASPAA